MDFFRVVNAYLAKVGEVVSDSKKQEALAKLDKDPQFAVLYFTKGILKKEEARPFALRYLKKYWFEFEGASYESQSRYYDTLTNGDLLTKEEARPFVLNLLKRGHYFRLFSFVELGLITKQEAKPFALDILSRWGNWELAAFPIAFLEILTAEEMKPLVFKYLDRDSSFVCEGWDRYISEGLLTKEEIKPYLLKSLEKNPDYVGLYLSQRLITKEEAKPYVSGDVDQLIRSMPESYTHSSHESRHEVNLILGAMKKLGVDKISWHQFQEVHPSSNKNLQNIFNTFKGKVVTRDQCLQMLSKNTDQHTYGLSYDFYGGNREQVFLEGKNQTVVKLHIPESLLSKLSPEARKRFDAIEGSHWSDNEFGWARVTKLEDKWFVEELQSDKNQYIGAVQHGIKEALKSGTVTDDIKKDQEFIAEMQRFSNWHEVLLSALLEAARESGVHEIYMHTGDTKLKDVNINQNKARNLYDKLPERMMFNKKQVNLGNGEHELWHRVASRVVYGYLSKVSEVVSDAEKQKALEVLADFPEYVEKYFDKDILTAEEAKPYVFRDLGKKSHTISLFLSKYFDKGLLTKEEARPFALEALKKYNHSLGDFFDREFITLEEARGFALKFLAKADNSFTFNNSSREYVSKGILTEEEVKRLKG